MKLLVVAIIVVTFARVLRIFREAEKKAEEEKKDAPPVDNAPTDARAGESA
jgi:hypothetical protein